MGRENRSALACSSSLGSVSPDAPAHVPPHHRQHHQGGDHHRHQTTAGPQQDEEDEGDHWHRPDDPDGGGKEDIRPSAGAGEGGGQRPSRVPASSPARTRPGRAGRSARKTGYPRQLDQRSQDRGRAGKDEGLAHSQGGQLPHHQPEGQGKEGPQQTVRADSTGCHRGCCRR